MALAALLALSILAAGPAEASPPTTTLTVDSSTDQEIPPGAPTDDYGFVAWCYGAMDESISVYERVLPELKRIDAQFGSPVKEPVPYAKDVAEERIALKRFAAAMEAAERASPRPIAPEGVAAMTAGRSIWDQAKLGSPRQLVGAWLEWGSPDRCETVAKNLKAKATLLGQVMKIGAPTVDPAPQPDPAPAPQPAAPATAPGPVADTPPADPAKPAASIDSVLDTAPPAPDAAPPAKP